jgi:hypothetical protein
MYNICLIGIVTLNASLYNEYIIIKIYLKMKKKKLLLPYLKNNTQSCLKKKSLPKEEENHS